MARAKPSKTDSAVGAERVRRSIQSQDNPIRGLTPQRLVGMLEQFQLGYLRDAARLWDYIRRRDDLVPTVVEKRERAAALLNWEILQTEDTPESARHKAALEDFYNSITVTHALHQDQRGGVSLLVRQMLDAVGKRYAAHEIVWQPSPGAMSAEIRFVPLWFFENITGKLRFLEQDYAAMGRDLEDGGWIVTVGDGLMEATSIAYLFKTRPLRAWAAFVEKFGIPGLHGKTDAAKGSPEWNAFRDALASYGEDWSLITNIAAEIKPLEVAASGGAPHPTMVDRMDRAISRLWCGGDLSTMSKDGSAVGSNPQREDSGKIEEADALLITETLQHQVDTWVIRYLFGTEPRAYFRLVPTPRDNVELELKVDQFLLGAGVPLGIADLRERYGRAEPEPGEVLARAAAPTAPGVSPANPPGVSLSNPLANEAAATAAQQALFDARIAHAALMSDRIALAPLLDALQPAIAAWGDDAALHAALQELAPRIPAIEHAILRDNPGRRAALESAIADTLSAAFGNGIADGAASRGKPAQISPAPAGDGAIPAKTDSPAVPAA